MKKNITLLLLILPFLVKAVNYTSIANGNWNVSTNWNPHGIPGASDTATINTSITFNTAESIFTIIINSSQTLTVSGANTLTVKGNFTNNGTFTPATGTVTFNSTGAKTLGGSTQTTFYILTSGNSGSLTLGNNITTTSDLDIYSGTFDVSASNYSVTVGGDFLMNGTFTYQNGTVTMNGSSAPTLGGSNLFMNNLIINGAVTMINTCRVLNCTINSGYSLTQTSSAVFVVRGDLTNNGTYTAAFHTQFDGTGTVLSGTGTFNQTGSTLWYFYNSPQTINCSNLTLNSSAQFVFDVADAQTYFGVTSVVITNLGTVIANDGITDNGTSSNHAIWINGTNATLEIAGSFLAHSYDTLHASATGNTIDYIGSTATIKNPAGGVFYNLTANSSGTLSLPASLTIVNNLLISSNTLDATTSNYNLTIGGNFTNNATFNGRSGTVTMNGILGQTIGGTTSTTFYNLTGSSSGSEAITLGNNESVSNNLLISSGTFTLSGTSYNLDVAGNFTSSSGTLTATSGAVIMNGSGGQTLGGSQLITLCKLIVGTTGTTTLGGNVTTTSDITINSALSGGSYTLKTAGDFIDNGTFTASTSTVYFNNSGHQCIRGTAGTVTFKNLTVASLSILGNTGIVNIGGTITILPGGRMDCTCP